MARAINDAGVRLVQEFEGCKLEAYPDPGTGGAPWTVGWGSTGPDIGPGTVWTQEEADARFLDDLGKFADGVDGLVRVALTDNQFAALVSFAYNVGLGALAGSTLLRKLNADDYQGAADQLPRWNKGGGRVLPGLVRRRAAERDLFLSDA